MKHAFNTSLYFFSTVRIIALILLAAILFALLLTPFLLIAAFAVFSLKYHVIIDGYDYRHFDGMRVFVINSGEWQSYKEMECCTVQKTRTHKP